MSAKAFTAVLLAVLSAAVAKRRLLEGTREAAASVSAEAYQASQGHADVAGKEAESAIAEPDVSDEQPSLVELAENSGSQLVPGLPPLPRAALATGRFQVPFTLPFSVSRGDRPTRHGRASVQMKVRTSRSEGAVLAARGSAAAALGAALTLSSPAFAATAGDFHFRGPSSVLLADLDYQGSRVGEDKQIASGEGFGAEKKENSKIQGGGASTLQQGRRITITRGVNLDNTEWKGENLRGVAFQQSVVRSANFEKADLKTASFFDADLSNSNFKDANMAEVNLEMADLTGADLTNADLTNAYMTGAVVNGPKGGLTKIDNTDWTDAQLRKDQRTYLCTIAKGENPTTGVETRMSLMCKD